MRGPLLALCFITLSLGWFIFFGAGARSVDFDAALLFLGATALFYWTFRSGQTPPRLPLWQRLALGSLPVYAAFQLIPLPLSVLKTFSPARALMTYNLAGVIPNVTHAPISVVPAASLHALFALLACLTIFSLLRDIAWRLVDSHPWLPALPLAAIATAEAGVAMGEWLTGAHKMQLERSTGLLEIALPFTLVFGFISFRRFQIRNPALHAHAFKAAAAWGASLMLLLALFHSSSVVSHTVVAASICIVGSAGFIPRLKTKKLRWFSAVGAAAFALLTLMLAPPPDLAGSPLLDEFRWFGAGPGGFASTFLKYQDASDLRPMLNPGNDLLALLISFGVVGFALVLVALVGLLRPAIVGAVFLADESRRLLAVAATAAVLGAVLRSGLESSFSGPALVMAFAWLAGLSQSAGVD